MYQLNKIQSILEFVYEKGIKYTNFNCRVKLARSGKNLLLKAMQVGHVKQKKSNKKNLKSCKTNYETNLTSAVRENVI